MWKGRLQKEGWSVTSVELFLMHWSASTLKQYNRAIVKYKDFCVRTGVEFPATSDNILSSFLCEIGQSSSRPKSQLNVTLSALKCMFNAKGMHNHVNNEKLQLLVHGIVKACTLLPMHRTPVMPIDCFTTMFEAWPTNEILPIKDLRLKVICLISLVFMLRPSDIAPHGVTMDYETLQAENMTFSREQVEISETCMALTFHAIKNDSSRDGFKVTIPRGTNPKLDPVHAMEVYLFRTDSIRESVPNHPVFLTLHRPYHGLSSSSISKVLQEAIDAAGLKGKGYTAKCFRPTGATKAVANGVNHDTARHIGRWASAEVFEKHYVHTRVPETYVDTILS